METRDSYIAVAPNSIKPNSEYTVSVTLSDIIEPIAVEVGISGPSFNRSQTIEFEQQKTSVTYFKIPSNLENGTYTLTIQDVNGVEFSNSADLIYEVGENVTVIGSDIVKSETEKNVTAKRFGPLNLNFKREPYRVAKDQLIKINSTESIQYAVYDVFANGKLVKHQYFEIGGEYTTDYITITPTSDMMPKANIFVYFIQNDTLIWRDLKMLFANSSDCENNSTEYQRLLMENADDATELDGMRKPPGEESGLITLTDATYDLEPGLEYKHRYYTIVAPGTLQSGSEYTATVSIHDSYETASIKIGISGPSYNKTKTIEVPAYGSQMVRFDIPNLNGDTYELQTEGLKGLIFKRYAKLVVKPYFTNVYIQTDKAMYKPGDKVKYRILVLDGEAKPVASQHLAGLTLNIYDSEGNRMRSMDNLNFTKGLHRGVFPLAEHTILGKWSIEIYDKYSEFSDNEFNIRRANAKAKKIFEISKYVLPKFSVTLECDKKVAILDRKFAVTIRSKYVHGRPVNGNATITAYIPGNRLPKAEKNLPLIDGKAVAEFSFNEDIIMDHFKPHLQLLAIVTEHHTGEQENCTTTISIERSRYTIELPNMQSSYVLNQTFELKPIIRKLNGGVPTHSQCTAKLILNQYNQGGNMDYGLIFETDVDRNGVAIFKLNFSIPATYNDVAIMYEEKIQHFQGFTIVADSKAYQDEEGEANDSGEHYYYTPQPRTYYPPSFGGVGIGRPTVVKAPVGPLKIACRNNNLSPLISLKLGEEIVLDIESDDPIPYFFYTIMSRGKIVEHKYVKVDGDGKKSYELKIKPTHEMSPKAKIFAYLIDDGDMKSDTMTLNVPGTFKNKLLITGPPAANASDEITLQIQTDPKSFVGLLAVDQSVLLMKSGNDFSGKQIYNDLEKMQSVAPDTNGRHGTYPGKDSGFLTITNACYPRQVTPTVVYRGFGDAPGSHHAVAYSAPQYSTAAMSRASSGGVQPAPLPNPEPTIRHNFVETWIFDDIESTDSNGFANISKIIPDTMTSWIISGFSLNEKTGFGITETATNISVSQPFFVSTSLPYSVKRGEILNVPVIVFNSIAIDIKADVSLQVENNEFSFADAEGNILTDQKINHEIEVKSNSDASTSFKIYPRILGELTLTVKAISPWAGDSIQHKLRVEPEGVTQYKNQALFLNLPSSKQQSHTFEVEIPQEVVKDSEYLQLIAGGDLFSYWENLENMIGMPGRVIGGAEENILNFNMHLLILQYLDVMHVEKPDLKERVIRSMETAYQRQLSYRHPTGSFCRFSWNCIYSQPDVQVTARVARTFIQAQKYLTIDQQIIDKALDYLSKIQSRKGQYSPDKPNEVATTAFVLLSFLEDKHYAKKYRAQIRNAVHYISLDTNRIPNTYNLALATLALRKVNSPLYPELFERLQQLWKLLPNSKNDVETMAYFLQILLEETTPQGPQDETQLLSIVKKLINGLNSVGGFTPTRGTIASLEALIKFSEKYNMGAKGKIDITYEALNSAEELLTNNSFGIDNTEALTLKAFELPKSTRKLIVSAVGKGSGLLQLSYHYNVLKQEETSDFNVTYKVKMTDDSSDYISLNICAQNNLEFDIENSPDSNMMVMDVYLPSGFITYPNALDKILEAGKVQHVDSRNDNTLITIYIDELPVCLKVFAEKYHHVENLQPGVITLYDYYDPKKRSTVFYDIEK
ncbi:thioester-containing protein 1 allele R1-like [Musca vetustissima]|uniref:thioester-containing protein 1 allele R1-like n=1 Tax=Musca vetustissima TaxID=27455 RepID=UPI002AB7AAD7|nr:thioester-containing protein 1 allele R1-like [Musca vetustissima]